MLKDHNRFPPARYGWRVWIPELKTLSPPHLDYHQTVHWVWQARQSNKALFNRAGIPLDLASAAVFVDETICAELARRFGNNSQWCHGTNTPATLPSNSPLIAQITRRCCGH